MWVRRHMPPRTRRATAAKSTPGAALTFDCVTGFLAPPMLENLLPVMAMDDIGRLAQSSTQMSSIMATAEASACVLRALGPIKEILARARALVTGEATSHDVWLWDPPPGNPACGDRGLNASWEDRGEPIEYDRSGLNGAWVRNLVSFLEGSPERVVGPQFDEDDYEDEHVRRGSSRLASANSRPGILKRIKALEETNPLQIYKGVRKILRRLIQGFGLSGQRLAWRHCIRFGLDGLLPLVFNARSQAAPPPPPGGRKRRGGAARRTWQPLVVRLEVDDDIPTGGPIFGFQEYRNALTLAAYLGHTNVLAAVVRMGATCSWDEDQTCVAFHTAVRHNRHDVVRCLCTPKASGGCGLELASLPRRDVRKLVWRTLMEDIDRLQYQVIWLGPDFDPDELGCEGSRGRRCIRSGYVWVQVVEMIRLLVELGMPAHKFLPRVSAERIEEIEADWNNTSGKLLAVNYFSDFPSQERRALESLALANEGYNQQFQDVADRLDPFKFHAWLLGLWPSGTTTAAAAAEDEESESESEGEESEGEDVGTNLYGGYGDMSSDDDSSEWEHGL